jgi:hypothetical protein
MRQILETEEHVAVPPMMHADPFYRITYLIKEQIRIHKWFEGEQGGCEGMGERLQGSPSFGTWFFQ